MKTDSLFYRLLQAEPTLAFESTRQPTATADAETLLVWGERVLDANNLDEVWG